MRLPRPVGDGLVGVLTDGSLLLRFLSPDGSRGKGGVEKFRGGWDPRGSYDNMILDIFCNFTGSKDIDIIYLKSCTSSCALPFTNTALWSTQWLCEYRTVRKSTDDAMNLTINCNLTWKCFHLVWFTQFTLKNLGGLHPPWKNWGGCNPPKP